MPVPPMADLAAWIAEPFHQRFLVRALATCLLLGIGASALGCVLVVRRLALMGDALAHALLPGVGIAWLLFGASLTSLLLGGLAAGLLTALASGLISRLTRVKEDAAFGALFIALYGAGVAVVSATATPVDLLHFLFGNVLAIGDVDLVLAAGVSALTVGFFALAYRPILLECFDPTFHRACGGHGTATHLALLALVVVNLVASLHALGVVLALGLFLLPAVTAYLWCDRWLSMLLVSAAVSAAGCVLGLVASYRLALATGPCIVATLGVVFVASAVLSPRHGLAARLVQRRHLREDDHGMCER